MNKTSILEQIETLIGYHKKQYKDNGLIDNIKEVCVDRLCVAVGVECDYNYKSDFFNFYAEIFGQAVVDLLGFNLVIASDVLRLFKHNHINLVEQVRKNIEEKLMEEAVLDSFDLIDKYKFLIPHIKKFQGND